MFSLAEKQAAYSFNSAGGDKTQELGSLGLSVDEFKTVLATLKKRSECLFAAKPVGCGLITDRTTQNSLLGLLGPKKKTESVSASNGSEAKKSLFKNNLKNKIDAEEAAIKTVFEILASVSPSEDNPLKDDGIVISANPWSTPSEKQLEYIFREGVCLDVDYTNVKYGRYLGCEDTGDCPFVLTVRFEIRILQCLLLNFSWFANRLYIVMKELNIESRASSTSIVFSDALNNGWADMMVKHCIKQDKVPAALKFMRAEYSTAYNKINNSGKKPTYFAVEFEIEDNAIGLADSDMEHQGTAYVEWKCFNSIKKNAGEEFGTNGFQQRRFGTDNVLFRGSATETETEDGGVTSASSSANNAAAAAAAEIINFGTSAKNDIGNGQIYDSVVDNSSWMKSIMEEINIGGGGSTAEYEKFRSGTSTVTVNQSSAVSLVAMAKGNESKVLVDSMIKFFDDSVKAIDDPYMYSGDCVFSEDQRENYKVHKDVYLAAICSNPSNIYRVMCHLFSNLLLSRLRNPVRETRQISSQPLGNGRTKVMIEYGCGDVQFGTPQYAKGKVRISGKRSCECRKMCKEPRCFDNNRLANTLRNGGSNPDPVERRHHNSHRSNAYDFRFFDKLEDRVREMSNKKKPVEKEYTMNYDFLAHDRNAFDLLSKCFPSASLHHVYCPDVLMIYRGDNFNIDLKNIKLDCITETSQSEEITSSQTVNVKDALTVITGNKLRKGADIVEHLKSSGISLREFLNKTSRVVRNLNELTSKLCNTFSATDDMKTINAILTYIKRVIPTLETILSFVNIEDLQKPFDELKAYMSETGSNDKSVAKKTLKASFALFRALAKFLLRNYNASVAAAINRRGYLTNTATITGYRFKSDGNVIYYHETIAAVSSCVAYADYFSSRSDKDRENSDETGMANIDGTVSSLMGDFSSDSINGNNFNSKKKNDDYNTFMKIFAGELLGGDNDEDEDEEENEEKKKSPLPSMEEEEEEKECKEESLPSLSKSPQEMKRSLSSSDSSSDDESLYRTKRRRKMKRSLCSSSDDENQHRTKGQRKIEEEEEGQVF
uniref:Wsv285-like protein n=1 Tax=Metopaulias depressus WSSV-like virus TaxID=1675544 RepID=A0A0K0VLB1_9VIRU|nr:wsv285-like protein [Metopaulias depressus WSSV-like virus]